MKWCILSVFIGALCIAGKIEATSQGERLSALREDYEHARELFLTYKLWEDASVSDRDIFKAWNDLWSVVGEWTVAYLEENPVSPPDEMIKKIEELPWLHATAVQLSEGEHAIYVIAAYIHNPSDNLAMNGTFFVVTRTNTKTFHVAWTIKDIAGEHYATHDEIGYWAYVGFAYSDGPLIGHVSALPPSKQRYPRFAIDATAMAFAGGFPKQISIWEWNGSEAHPLLIHNYQSTGRTGDVEFDGAYIKIPTKERFKTMFTCGTCPTPRAIWTLRITPDGVEDLGREYDNPELKMMDELWARLLKSENVDEMASPQVIETINRLIEDEGYTSEEFAPLSGLGRYYVANTEKHHSLCFSVDNLSVYLLFEIEKRSNSFYFSTVRIFDEDWNDWVDYCENITSE